MRFVENLSFENTLKTSGKDRENTLKTSGKDTENSHKTSGKDRKNTLKTSGEDRRLDMSPLTRKVMTTRIGSLHSKRV